MIVFPTIKGVRMVDKINIPEGYVLNRNKKIVKPMVVPSSCNMWRDFFYIDKNNFKYWWYKTVKGEKLIIVKRIPDKDDPLKKSFQQGSYASGKYQKENIYKDLEGYKYPLFRLDEFVKVDKTIPVLITEGENTCEQAQKLFPDMFVTTFCGGASNYAKTDYSVLKGRNVTAWPDIEKSDHGRKKFEDLCLLLKDTYDIKVKLVSVPNYSELQVYFGGKWKKNGWDLADEIPEEINIHKLIETAEEPEPKTDPNIPYSDIEKHKDDYVYIANTGIKYWDRVKRTIVSQETINNLFLRAKGRGSYGSGKATDWLQKNNIQIVDGTTFYPVQKEFMDHEGKRLVNLYREPRFKPLEPGQEYDLSWLFDLMKNLCSYEEEVFKTMKDMFAQALQHPEVNRTWAALIYGGQGVGKGALFAVLEKCLGSSNCSTLSLSQMYAKFNSFMLRANNLFVRESNNKGSDDNQAQSTLKELITEENFEVELKGVDLIPHRCHYNLYMSTNSSNPIGIEKDDRRIWFVNCETPRTNSSREYFDDLWENYIHNHDRIREVFHYFKNVHKISEDFDVKHAPWTKWKADLIEGSLTGYAYELDKLFENKILPSFHYDLINKDTVMKDLRHWSIDDMRSYANPLSVHKGFSPKRLQNWINSISGRFKYRQDAIEPKGQKRGHYWVVRNFEYWRDNRDNIQAVHDHFNDLLTEVRIDKDMKANSCPFGDPWKSKKEKAADQERLEKQYEKFTKLQKELL